MVDAQQIHIIFLSFCVLLLFTPIFCLWLNREAAKTRNCLKLSQDFPRRKWDFSHNWVVAFNISLYKWVCLFPSIITHHYTFRRWDPYTSFLGSYFTPKSVGAFNTHICRGEFSLFLRLWQWQDSLLLYIVLLFIVTTIISIKPLCNYAAEELRKRHCMNTN